MIDLAADIRAFSHPSATTSLIQTLPGTHMCRPKKPVWQRLTGRHRRAGNNDCSVTAQGCRYGFGRRCFIPTVARADAPSAIDDDPSGFRYIGMAAPLGLWEDLVGSCKTRKIGWVDRAGCAEEVVD